MEDTQWYIDTTLLSEEWPNINNNFTDGYALGRHRTVSSSSHRYFYSRISRFENNTLFWRGRLMTYHNSSGTWNEGTNEGDDIFNAINIRYYWIAIG